MNSVELELKIKNMDSSSFQRICDSILKEKKIVVSLGNCEGVAKTRKGTPDSYIINKKTKSFSFVEYTIQTNNLKNKIRSDIDKCLKEVL